MHFCTPNESFICRLFSLKKGGIVSTTCFLFFFFFFLSNTAKVTKWVFPTFNPDRGEKCGEVRNASQNSMRSDSLLSNLRALKFVLLEIFKCGPTLEK